MTPTQIRRFFLAGVLVLLGSAPARNAAAPRIIMLYGGMLDDRKVFLTDWNENLRFMAATTEVIHQDAAELDRRSVIPAAFFWGHQWDAYATDPTKLNGLSPDLAGEPGVIYPAGARREALLVFADARSRTTGRIRRIASDGVKLLEKYNIPISVN